MLEKQTRRVPQSKSSLMLKPMVLISTSTQRHLDQLPRLALTHTSTHLCSHRASSKVDSHQLNNYQEVGTIKLATLEPCIADLVSRHRLMTLKGQVGSHWGWALDPADPRWSQGGLRVSLA